MKAEILGLALCLLLVSLVLAEDKPARLEPTLPRQRLEGWGTSLCWFANILGQWPEPVRSQLADALFGDKGLRLNIARYNFGGGDAPGHNHMRLGGQVPCFQPEPGVFDWKADPGQRWFLQAAKQLGANLFEAFANSPPWWMTESGCGAGATDPTKDNLKPSEYERYTDFLIEAVRHFRDEEGIDFRTLEPFNEPRSDYWKEGGNQEGCHFDVATQSLLIPLLARKLTEAGLATEIAASDETSIEHSLATWRELSPQAREAVAQVNTHAYWGWNRAALQAEVKPLGKRLWMSEYGGSVGAHDHDAMGSGLALAQTIQWDLADLGADAWVYWQAIENEAMCVRYNFNWGLLHADFEHPEAGFAYTKAYWVMAQYSRFLRPGCILISSGDPRTLAALDEETGKLILVAFNPEATEVRRQFDLAAFSEIAPHAQAFRTSATESLAALPKIPLEGSLLSLVLPAQSVTTLLIRTSGW